MELLHSAKFLVQSTDISKEEYLFDGCSSISKNFVRKFLLVLENNEFEEYIKVGCTPACVKTCNSQGTMSAT
jgi:hypothetical protein